MIALDDSFDPDEAPALTLHLMSGFSDVKALNRGQFYGIHVYRSWGVRDLSHWCYINILH